MTGPFGFQRKSARRAALRRLWLRSRPLLVALALISGSFNQTSRARIASSAPGEPSPADSRVPTTKLGPVGAVRMQMPEPHRANKAIIGTFTPLKVGRPITEETAAPGRLSDTVSARPVEGGDRRIKLGEGRDVMAVFTGPQELTQSLERDQAIPLSIASGDLDGDGVSDLACGYSIPGSGGAVAIYRGNQSVMYGPISRGNGLDSPFLPSATVLATPSLPDFIAIGDFDADGHQDLVVATLGLNKLYFLRGTSTGEFQPPEEVTLQGSVTTMITGDLNRRDGLTDIAVGVTSPNGPQLLVFEGPGGAMTATPEVLDLPAPASALALGQLDDEYPIDIAVAAGRRLIVIHGRDRKLSLDAPQRAEVKPAVIDRYPLAYEARSLVIGDFTGKQRDQIALLAQDGATHIWDRSRASSRDKWTEVSNPISSLASSPAGGILSAPVSGAPCDNLVRLDSAGKRMGVFALDGRSAGPLSFEVDGSPIAALPMRLNSDGIRDLVLLRSGRASLMVIRTEANQFTVGNTADGGGGSLRQAILDANSAGGPANISFAVGGTAPPVISPGSQLPTVNVPVTIDGGTEPNFGFAVLDGGGAGAGAIGMVLAGGNSLIRGLVIHSFQGVVDGTGTLHGGFGVSLNGNGNYTIESCFVGTNSSGQNSQGNGLGVLISSNNNLIGGTAQGTGNLISGNSFRGIGVGSTVNNLITGNFIGTDSRGAFALPNAGEGVFLNASTNNTISNNLISGNKTFGVELVNGASANLIGGNFIGTDVNGILGIGNSNFGVEILGSPNNGVGGASPQQRNVISGNQAGGITIAASGATGNLVQGNLIGTNRAGSAAVGNIAFGVFVGASNNTVGGAVTNSGNLISGTAAGPDGVSLNLGIEGAGTFGSNQVMGNLIGTDINGTIALGATQFGLAIDQSPNNTVGGTQPGTGNLVSGHTFDGIVVANASSTGNLIEGNFVGTDITGKLCIPNKAFGLVVTNAPGNTVTGNLVSCNGQDVAGTTTTPMGGVGIGSLFLGSFGDSSTLLKGNFIGVDATLNAPLGNHGDGVFVENDSINNQIIGNQIAFNQGAGIRIPDDPSAPSITRKPAVQITITGNLIYSNGGLAIDLGPLGPTPNPHNVQDGANHHQNFPLVNSATVGAGTVKGLVPTAATISVSGAMSASPNTTYSLEFFLGGSCDSGQGHEFVGTIPALLGSGNVSTDGSGNASYTFTFPVPASSTVSNGFVNATATDPVGNTSEFSLCAPVSGSIPAGPVVGSVQGAGKNLLVMGQNFDSGAVILENSNPQRTLHDDQNPSTTLIGKKVNKNITPGSTVTIQVQNSDGSLSNSVNYTR